MNAVTARLEGKKKKQSNKQSCKTSVSGAKRKDREGRRSEGLSKTEQQGDSGDGVGLAERQQEEGHPWSASRLLHTAVPSFMESDGEMCQGGHPPV